MTDLIQELKSLYEDDVEDIPGVLVLESTNWELEYKNVASQSIFFEYKGRFFEMVETKTIDYDGDTYEDPEFHEVFPRTIVKTVYDRTHVHQAI